MNNRPIGRDKSLCGLGCAGCSYCAGGPPGETDLMRLQRKKRESDDALANAKPTLKVTLGDLIKEKSK